MTEENAENANPAPKPDDPTQALQERITELDGLIDQLNALTDQLHEQTKPDSSTP